MRYVVFHVSKLVLTTSKRPISFSVKQVSWFEPSWYLDHETKDFLQACIRETHKKLIIENDDLLQKLQVYGGESINVKKIMNVILNANILPGDIVLFLHSAVMDVASDDDGLIQNLHKGCAHVVDMLTNPTDFNKPVLKVHNLLLHK